MRTMSQTSYGKLSCELGTPTIGYSAASINSIADFGMGRKPNTLAVQMHMHSVYRLWRQELFTSKRYQ